MKGWKLSIAAFLAIGGIALAAENPVITANQGEWTGLYAGMQIGYLWGDSDTGLHDVPHWDG